MIGVMALYLGVTPLDGDVNNLLPQMAGTYLPLVLLALIASGIYWQRRRRTLAIVDKTAEETRHE